MDLNKFAQEIAETEGKKIQVNIGQIKEILHITLEKLYEKSTKVDLRSIIEEME